MASATSLEPQDSEFFCRSLTRFHGADNPRQMRALGALMKGPLWREEFDRIAGASNGPDVAMQLRRRGLTKDHHLICPRLERIDRDGRRVLCGRYSLTAEGRRLVLEWMARERLTADDLVHAKGG